MARHGWRDYRCVLTASCLHLRGQRGGIHAAPYPGHAMRDASWSLSGGAPAACRAYGPCQWFVTVSVLLLEGCHGNATLKRCKQRSPAPSQAKPQGRSGAGGAEAARAQVGPQHELHALSGRRSKQPPLATARRKARETIAAGTTKGTTAARRRGAVTPHAAQLRGGGGSGGGSVHG